MNFRLPMPAATSAEAAERLSDQYRDPVKFDWDNDEHLHMILENKELARALNYLMLVHHNDSGLESYKSASAEVHAVLNEMFANL